MSDWYFQISEIAISTCLFSKLVHLTKLANFENWKLNFHSLTIFTWQFHFWLFHYILILQHDFLRRQTSFWGVGVIGNHLSSYWYVDFHKWSLAMLREGRKRKNFRKSLVFYKSPLRPPPSVWSFLLETCHPFFSFGKHYWVKQILCLVPSGNLFAFCFYKGFYNCNNKLTKTCQFQSILIGVDMSESLQTKCKICWFLK